MNNRIVPKTQVSRRGFLVGCAAVAGAGAVIDSSVLQAAPAQARTSAVDSAVIAASILYVNFDDRTASRYGVAKDISTLASGDGRVSPGGSNRMAPMLPLAGGSVAANTLPTGLEWHGASAPKTLVSYTADGFRYTGNTTSSTRYFGGVRTAKEVVAPGESVLVRFTSSILNLDGSPNASLLVQLLRTSDGKGTLYEIAMNAQEASGTDVVVRLMAPAGGTGGYKLVFNGFAGSSAAGQKATFDISNIVIIREPTAPNIGIRYALPAYTRSTYPVKSVVFSPTAAAGEYYLLVRTDEFGWASESVLLNGTGHQVNPKSSFGAALDVTVREAIVISADRWTTGWMGKLAPLSWIPIRYMNIDNSVTLSRAESPNRLARATGMVASSSILAPKSANDYDLPVLTAPADTWAAAYDPTRLSHMTFKTDTAKFIGETTSDPGSRSEIAHSKSTDYGQHYWTSFSIRANTTLTDPTVNKKAVVMQFRYQKNTTGDNSGLGPDLAFEQWTNNRWLLHYRTDNGVPVFSGSATPAGITTVELGPFDYVPGQWYRAVFHTVFSNAGGGYLGFWFNGKKIIDQAVAMGYKRDVGPKLRFGSYKYSQSPSTIEYQNLEFGTRDLTSRIARPLPV